MNYLASIAERIRREVPTDKLPDGDLHALFLMYSVLALAKGKDVTREDIHNTWVAWMTAQGKDHGSMMPFKDLPADIKAEDDVFAAAVRRVAVQLVEDGHQSRRWKRRER